jgi:hypothetical protein
MTSGSRTSAFVLMMTAVAALSWRVVAIHAQQNPAAGPVGQSETTAVGDQGRIQLRATARRVSVDVVGPEEKRFQLV